MYIKLEDGTICQTPEPDPTRVLTPEEAQEEIMRKEQEVVMYENEMTHLAERKEALQAEILELNNLIK